MSLLALANYHILINGPENENVKIYYHRIDVPLCNYSEGTGFG
jgi:hypothetical protein